MVLAVALSAAEATRSYSVGSHGKLLLTVPEGWSEDFESIDDALPPTITLQSPGGRVKMLVTPLWSERNDSRFNSSQNIKDLIAGAAERVAPTAREASLPIRELDVAGGKGYFFWATDKAPKAGEYEYMAQGAVPAGRLLVQFTILTHEPYPMGTGTALAIIRSVSQGE
jgi:hypothetical protein